MGCLRDRCAVCVNRVYLAHEDGAAVPGTITKERRASYPPGAAEQVAYN